ncbi:MAG: amidohydrolase family protein [Gemmatimonadota bacterium]
MVRLSFFSPRSVTMFAAAAASIVLLAPVEIRAQQPSMVSVDAPVVALTNATVIDGTGSAAMTGHTIVIRDGRIEAVGTSVDVPDGAEVIDATGHTVIPGLVGMHDHMYFSSAGGYSAQADFTGPRLYLGSGVTTLRTTGSQKPYADINLKANIDAGNTPGPKIHITAPYITGGSGGGGMARITNAESARRFVAYWASEGAEWIKGYTSIASEQLGAAIEEAHANGLKVTGHLCAVSFREAVALGIDNLEHGFLTATDFEQGRTPDVCNQNSMLTVGNEGDPKGEVAQDVIATMVANDVSMTSTLAVVEPFIANRPTKDERSLSAMAPAVRDAYLETREQIDGGAFPFTLRMLQKSGEFELEFHRAGGVLASGVDPTGVGGALPGYGDQRNLELLVEFGFTIPEAIQVGTLNGATILGEADETGSIEVGKAADLVLLEGDLSSDIAIIRNTVTVFKDGIGYDSARLIEAVQGRVGIN